MNSKLIAILLCLVAALCIYTFVPGSKAWPRGAWDAADHNRDGQLTRSEMVEFGQKASHRNSDRLLWHFDNEDTNGDKIIDVAEVDVKCTAIGSKDPNDHLPPPN